MNDSSLRQEVWIPDIVRENAKRVLNDKYHGDATVLGEDWDRICLAIAMDIGRKIGSVNNTINHPDQSDPAKLTVDQLIEVYERKFKSAKA